MLVDMRSEVWKIIDGYDGRYQVNPFGEVRRVCKHKFVRLTAFNRRGGWFVKLSQNYKGKEHKVSHLVAIAFLPPKQPGQVLWHKNGVLSDNFVGNLQWISRRELGKRTALQADKRRTVAKVARNGEVVSFYPSARAAARANNMSYQTVLDRCNYKVKKPFELDNHNYVFSDDLVG
ncbi:MAG TPA: NUMOD4 domain-containing protein [Clostridia bacterium]|nr:NUMOD4 domain-containing protein [Clostridia bacterium]